VPLTGTGTVVVLYRLPLDDDTMLQVACLEDALVPVHRLATGGDYGDELTRPIAAHWPQVHAMVLDGKRLADGRRWLRLCLCAR
jgi:hypothetical protein